MRGDGNSTLIGADYVCQGCSQDFHQGGAQLESEVVVAKLRMASFAGQKGWVREGDVPPPAEGGGFWHFGFAAIKLYWFSCVLSSILNGNWAQPLEGLRWPCHTIIQLTPSFIYECCTLIILSWA